MKIQNFNKQNLPELRKEINEALLLVSQKYGVSFDLGNISFNDESFTSKLTCTLVNKVAEESGIKVNAKWKADFDKNAWMHGLKDHFMKSFTMRNAEYVIVGMQPRKPNIIAKKGEGYVSIPVTEVKRALGL